MTFTGDKGLFFLLLLSYIYPAVPDEVNSACEEAKFDKVSHASDSIWEFFFQTSKNVAFPML